MVERQIDVIERIAYLMGDGRAEPSDYRRFLGLLQLGLEVVFLTKLSRHFIKPRREPAYLVASICIGNPNVKISCRPRPSRSGKIRDRTGKPPYKRKRD